MEGKSSDNKSATVVYALKCGYRGVGGGISRGACGTGFDAVGISRGACGTGFDAAGISPLQ